jgi:hypothetical protein
MQANPLLGPILADDTLTRGLGDAEARILVEWLVERAEELDQAISAEKAAGAMTRLCRKARGIARFVHLWCLEQDHGAANQLAVTERFGWPWPTDQVDPCELMHDILTWETAQLDEQPSWAEAA